MIGFPQKFNLYLRTWVGCIQFVSHANFRSYKLAAGGGHCRKQASAHLASNGCQSCRHRRFCCDASLKLHTTLCDCPIRSGVWNWVSFGTSSRDVSNCACSTWGRPVHALMCSYSENKARGCRSTAVAALNCTISSTRQTAVSTLQHATQSLLTLSLAVAMFVP